MAEVTYPDMDNSVTALFPIVNLNEEYKMPEIGEEVLVLHLSNGAASGLILGPFWNEANKPAVNGKNVFRKEFSKSPRHSLHPVQRWNRRTSRTGYQTCMQFRILHSSAGSEVIRKS